MIKKISRALLLGICVGLTVVGCNSGGHEEESEDRVDQKIREESQEDETEQKEKIVLNTVSIIGEGSSIAYIYEQAIDEFLLQNTEVVVRDYSASPNQQFQTNVQAMFSTGEQPDVMFWFVGDAIENIADKDQFVGIDEIREVYPEFANHIDEQILSLAAGKDGVTYAVPIQAFSIGLYCNKDLFDEYEVELPTTIEAFEEAIEVFGENGVPPIAVAIDDKVDYLLESLIMIDGGIEAFSREDVLRTNGVWLSVFDNLLRISESYELTDTDFTHQHAVDQFINKEAAMIIEGDWIATDLLDDNVVFLPFPSVTTKEDGKTQMVTELTGGFYITRSAWEDETKRESAINLVETMTQPNRLNQIIEETGGQSVMDVGEVERVKSAKLWVEDDIWEYIKENIPKVIAEERTVSDVVNDIIYRYWEVVQLK